MRMRRIAIIFLFAVLVFSFAWHISRYEEETGSPNIW